jgi:hypothetical protein
MRKILVYVILALALLFVWKKATFWNREVNTTHHTVLKEITDLGKLELVKYAYRDVVEQKIVRDFLPDPKALLIIEGEAVGCIDLKKVKEDDLQFNGDTLIVHLPSPEICYHKIDHEKSRVYHTEYAFMNEGLLLEEAYKRAEKQILQSALEADILGKTKANATLVVKPLLENASGKKVVLRFPLEGELQRLK